MKKFLKFGDDWVLIHDVTLREYFFLKEGRVLEALPFLIEEWSEKEPINLATVGKLKTAVVSKILRESTFKIRKFLNLDMKQFSLALKNFFDRRLTQLKGTLLEEWENELLLVQLSLNDLGSINALPERGSLLDQPAHFIFFLLAARQAIAEILEDQKKRGGGPWLK